MTVRARVVLFVLSTSIFLSTAAQTPPKFRLPAGVAPTHYNVELTVAPDKDSFSGVIDIAIKFAQPTSVLWLNAQSLKIKEASLESNGKRMTAKAIEVPEDFVGFAFESPVGPGTATLHVAYEGQVSRKDMEGIFQRKDGDQWYVYSQFENIAARKAFPCFDEPGFKVPWQLTLHVPQQFGAFSNTPAVTETNDDSGIKTVRFAETKPLPSYLVAIAVGPFEVLEGRSAGAKKTEVRIVYPQGHPGEAQFAVKVTPEVLEYLEGYFGIPYPYEKLDEVAIPKAGYAMEHPGLVTYGSSLFLMPSDQEDVATQRISTSIIAHELAHQWFGDLVTTAWWDDTWLNEGFASWMASKVIRQYHPEWNSTLDDLNVTQEAMHADELRSARKVRQPILDNNDITNAFDNLTYDKGNALLRMFESYIGEKEFQQRIHQYLEKYAWRNATSADFLSEIAGRDREITDAFTSFLEQPGVPLVSAELHCGPGKPVLQLSQQRFVPHGSASNSSELWGIPVCVSYGDTGNEGRQCTLLKAKSSTLSLNSTTKCPAWFYGNAEQAGYYHTKYTQPMLRELVDHQKTLALVERVGLLGDLAAMSRATTPLGQILAILPKFAQEKDREVITKTIDITGDLEDHLVPTNLLPQYHRYIEELYKTRAEELGLEQKDSDTANDKLLRPELIEVMAMSAENPQWIKETTRLATEWLEGRSMPDPNTIDRVLYAAAQHGDRKYFNLLHGAIKKEKNELWRYFELRSLGMFRDPKLLQEALSMVANSEFEPRDAMSILSGARMHPYSEDPAFKFLTENWEALIARVPVDQTLYVPKIAMNFCDAQHRSETETFFRPRVEKLEGGPRALEQVLEGISLCIANKEANEPSVVEFLKKY